MAYTVNKLAKLSGVTVRTLHFYDEIGLLKPAFYGENNYRYYEQEQLLSLQQILFYRELGFQLNDIQRIMYSNDFNKIEALQSHKKILEQSINNTKTLINTIDKTLSHLRGNTIMRDEELYYGFDSEKQKAYEQELVDQGWVSQEKMEKYREKSNKMSKADQEKYIQESKRIFDALQDGMKQQIQPSVKSTQDLLRAYYDLNGGPEWIEDKQSYLGLIELYHSEEFKKFFDRCAPGFLTYISEAMKVFAEEQWI